MADSVVPKRVSWEARAIATLREAIGNRTSIEPSSGMGGLNRIAPESWELKVMQRFPYGDLRYETDTKRVIVEVESGGGLTNLVKYWPMLGNELKNKRFVLAHLFMVSSESDYIAHRGMGIPDRADAARSQAPGMPMGPGLARAHVHLRAR